MLILEDLFDEEFYLKKNQDVADAVRKKVFPNGLSHFLQFGKKEKRDPSIYFNTVYYLGKNPDVKKAVDTGSTTAIDHFISYGQKEGRNPSIEYDAKLTLKVFLFVEKNNTDDLKKLITEIRTVNLNLDLEIKDSQGNTPLHLAVQNGKQEIVNILLNNGAKPTTCNNKSRTPLHLAAQYGHLNLIISLIEQGAFVDECDIDLQTPLHLAAQNDRSEALELLKRNGANIDAKNKEDQTPLHFAAKLGHIAVVETLIFLGADAESQDKNGYTIIHSAIENGQLNVLDKLHEISKIKYAGLLKIYNKEGLYPIHFAALKKQLEIIKKLYSQGDNNIDLADVIRKNTVLHYAVLSEDVPSINWVAENASKSLLTATNKDGKTPLMLAPQGSPAEGAIKNQININININKVKASAVPNVKKDSHKIQNLVFEGGGVKGIAYLGAVEALERNKIKLSEIKRVAGTSAGAISALLIGLGYNLEDLKKELTNLDFKDFLDGDYKDFFLGAKKFDLKTIFGKELTNLYNRFKTFDNRIIAIASLIFDIFKIKKEVEGTYNRGIELLSQLNSNLGLFEGEFLRNWFESRIVAKTKIKNATFKELYDLKEKNKSLNLKDMYFIGTNLTTSEYEIFSYEHTPHMIIADAVRISMSLPLIFKPHALYIKNDGKERVVDPRGHIYVDGGIIENYPVKIFDKLKYLDLKGPTGQQFLDKNHHVFNEGTLGLRLITINQHAAMLNQQPSNVLEINNLSYYIYALVSSFYNKQNADYIQSSDNLRTILIPDMGINTADFELGEVQKNNLINSGEMAVYKFLRKNGLNTSPSYTLLELLNTHGLKMGSITDPALVFEFYRTANSRDISVLKNLVDVNCRSQINGETALHIAVKKEDEECLKKLLSSGAVDCPDKSGKTALDIAASSNNKNLLSLINNSLPDHALIKQNTNNRLLNQYASFVSDTKKTTATRGYYLYMLTEQKFQSTPRSTFNPDSYLLVKEGSQLSWKLFHIDDLRELQQIDIKIIHNLEKALEGLPNDKPLEKILESEKLAVLEAISSYRDTLILMQGKIRSRL